MTTLFRGNPAVQRLCKQLMALNLIPWQKVSKCFKNLVIQAKDLPLKRSEREKLFRLFKYVKYYWIDCNTWPPSTWCVYMQSIRTNNDTEGWHTRLHKLAGLLNQSGMNFYTLVELLYHDANSLDLNLKLLFQHRSLRRQRPSSRLVNGKIFSLWEAFNSYSEDRISSVELLEKLSKVHCANIKLKKSVDDHREELDEVNY